jgi:hypothetical protein
MSCNMLKMRSRIHQPPATAWGTHPAVPALRDMAVMAPWLAICTIRLAPGSRRQRESPTVQAAVLGAQGHPMCSSCSGNCSPSGTNRRYSLFSIAPRSGRRSPQQVRFTTVSDMGTRTMRMRNLSS